MPLAIALTVSVIISLAAFGLRALTAGGALAATLVGTMVLGGAGWPGLAMLGTFFAGSTAISRLAPDVGAAFDAKGARRDWAQVFANGGAAAVGAWHPEAASWIVVSALGAAAADTWATSAGGWSRRPPRHILSFETVAPGTSGGVTWIGTLGALTGAATVGAAGHLAGGAPALFPVAVGLGMLGMLVDSAMGAGIQGRYHCEACGMDTERSRHRCGRPARHTGGSRWISNDGVNAIATAAAALAGWAAWACWARAA